MQKLRQRYRYSAILLREMVRTDFKLRYQGSALGYLWSLLRPLFMFTILYFVFVKLLGTSAGIEHPAVYLLLGIVLWNFFVEVTTGSVSAIVGKGDLLRKINFPKYIIILAILIGAVINLAFNLVVVGIFMVLNHVEISSQALLFLPLLVELFVLSLAMGFVLSALFVRFRDVTFIWDVVVQAGFYLTPVLYVLSSLPEQFQRYGKLMILNPMAQIIQDARYVLVTPQSSTIHQLYPGNRWVWLIPIGSVVILMIVGSLYFRSQSKKFAEEV